MSRHDGAESPRSGRMVRMEIDGQRIFPRCPPLLPCYVTPLYTTTREESPVPDTPTTAATAQDEGIAQAIAGAQAACAEAEADGADASTYTVTLPEELPTLERAHDQDSGAPAVGSIYATRNACGRIAVWDLGDALDCPEMVLSVDDAEALIPLLARLVVDKRTAEQARRAEGIDTLSRLIHPVAHDPAAIALTGTRDLGALTPAAECGPCHRSATVAWDAIGPGDQ